MAIYFKSSSSFIINGLKKLWSLFFLETFFLGWQDTRDQRCQIWNAKFNNLLKWTADGARSAR